MNVKEGGCNNHPISSAFQRPKGASREVVRIHISYVAASLKPRKLPLESKAKHCRGVGGARGGKTEEDLEMIHSHKR